MGHVWMLLVFLSFGCAASPEYSDSYLAASVQVLMNLLHQLEFQKHDSVAVTEVSGIKPDEPSPIKASFRNTDSDKNRAAEEAEDEAKKRLMDLYVVLNGEARRQGVGKTQGFSDKMLARLEYTSYDSAAGQLSTVLKGVLNGGEAKREASRHLVEDMIFMLDDESSSVSIALKHLEPLPYRH